MVRIEKLKRNLPPLKSLYVFEVAASTLSFTAAATELNLTQSAVSKQIKLLETYLGNELFIRKNNQLKLTEAGELLLLNVKPSLDIIEATCQDNVSMSSRHHLNIAAPPTFLQRWLVPCLNGFRQKYANITLNFSTIYDYSLLEKKSSQYDIIIFYGDGYLKKAHVSPLLTETYISVCHKDLIGNKTFNEVDLTEYTLIHLGRESRAYLLWERWMKVANIEIFSTKNGLWFDNFECMIVAALNKEGFAIVDKNLVQQELAKGQLIQWHPTEITLPFGYWLAVPYINSSNPAIECFKQFLLQEADKKSSLQGSFYKA